MRAGREGCPPTPLPPARWLSRPASLVVGRSVAPLTRGEKSVVAAELGDLALTKIISLRFFDHVCILHCVLDAGVRLENYRDVGAMAEPLLKAIKAKKKRQRGTGASLNKRCVEAHARTLAIRNGGSTRDAVRYCTQKKKPRHVT